MSKTLALMLATSLAASSAMPALAGGLDDAIIEAPIAVEPAPAPAGSLGLGGLGAAGAVVGGLVAVGIIAAIVDDDDSDDTTPDN